MSKKRRYTSSRKKSVSKRSGYPNWIWILGFVVIAGLALGAIALTQPSLISSDSSNDLPPTISVEEAFKKYEAGTLLLDVRTPEEWEEYHAPNTTLIPLDELESRVSELPQGEEIVVVCRSGNRSQQGRDILKNSGFTQVTSMDGGLKQWRDAGYPVVSGQ